MPEFPDALRLFVAIFSTQIGRYTVPRRLTRRLVRGLLGSLVGAWQAATEAKHEPGG